MTLSLAVRHEQGDFTLEAAFDTDARVVALFGPSGSGKTTLLNVIAGLLRPQMARVEAAGRVLVDTKAGFWLPPHRRRVGYVFQDARLFPHLSVRANLLYGRWLKPSHERFASLDDVTALLGIGHLLARGPGTLSGGEAQRVAIGRALLAAPRLLLFDEPLASLDEARRAETLPYLERLRDAVAVPMVYVSHNRAEVERLADEVMHLEGGRVVRRERLRAAAATAT